MPALNWKPIQEAREIVSESVFRKAEEVGVEIFAAEIDPAFMNGMDFCNQYGVDPSDGANCVIVEAVRGGSRTHVAVIVPVGFRADLNGVVRKHLDAKRVSFANLDEVIKETGMEYGSITPFGLPDSYKILVDKRIMDKETLVVGSGKQIAKIRIPTSIFRELSNTEIAEGIAKEQ